MENHSLSTSHHQSGSFKTYVQGLIEKFQPLQLFCFAKSKTLIETSGCFTNQQGSHNCDYCLLMVTASSNRIDHEVQDFTNTHYFQGTIAIICHGQETILEAIRSNNRFFMTVCSSGQLLYSHDGMIQVDYNGNFIPTQSGKKALRHFNHRMPLAEGFLHGAAECLSKQDFSVSTFMLHQVAEQCCILLIRVQLAYRSEVHSISRLLRLCTSFSERPIKMFLSGCPEDERLFDILQKSYSGSRYKDNFKVSEKDARSLFDRVSRYVDMVKEMCVTKIEELEYEAVLYKELHGESEVQID